MNPPSFYNSKECELCKKRELSLKCMFDLVPPIYNHYPHLCESDVLYLCSFCHEQLDKTKTNFLTKNPNWHKHTPDIQKQQINTTNKSEKEKTREQMYNNAIKDITQQHEKQYRFVKNTYQLFGSSPNIINTECLKSPTGSNSSDDSFNSCKSPIPTAKQEHKNFS